MEIPVECVGRFKTQACMRIANFYVKRLFTDVDRNRSIYFSIS